MGFMSAMAAYCQFAAAHGLIKKETEEEKQAKLEEEKRAQIRKQKRKEYFDFWVNAYSKISDESAIANIEYALDEVHTWACKMRFPESFSEDKVHLRYPVAHCEALLETHTQVIYKHLRRLEHEAFYGRGRYSIDNKTEETEMRRIHRIGEVANYYLNNGAWFV